MANNRRSEVDKHPAKQEIEACLARKVPLRKLEKRHGISISALSRHRQRLRDRHPKVYEALAASQWAVTPAELERVRTETAEGWLIMLRGQVDKLISGQDLALGDQRYASAAQLAGQAHVAMKMLGEATGNLSDGAARVNVQNNITYTAEFHELRSTILQALRGYPEALGAVLAALRADGGSQASTAALPAPMEACAA